MTDATIRNVGLLGLGIMGSAIAANLIERGFSVCGFDPDPSCRDALTAAGGRALDGALAVARESQVVLLSLPSAAALTDSVAALRAANGARIAIETSTLAIDEKIAARDALADAAITLLDCPLSGTGAQARTRDLSVYASGDAAACARVAPVFEGFARAHYYLGEFGNGMKMKLVANHLVTIHNVAAAEAMVLAMKAGLDPQTVYQVVGDGAGSSRMFQVRGPMMVAGRYEPATMKIDVYRKDLALIDAFATALACPLPLFDASVPIYEQARAQGRDKQDTAAVCAVLEAMAGHRRM